MTKNWMKFRSLIHKKWKILASINQSREEEKEITREGHGDLDFNTKGQIRKRAFAFNRRRPSAVRTGLTGAGATGNHTKIARQYRRSEMPIFKMYYNEPMVVL